MLAYRKQINADDGVGVTGAANLNRTRVKDAKAGAIDARNRRYFQERLPKRVENITLD